MSAIRFDDGVAAQLASAAHATSEKLRDQGHARRTAASDAVRDFHGAYATAFTACTAAEGDDRALVSRVLAELADAVSRARLAAEQEKQRQADVAEWTERKERSDRGVAMGLSPDPLVAFRIPPSTAPTPPPALSAAFAPRERKRMPNNSGGGKSSADPARLRAFVHGATPRDAALAQAAAELTGAWNRFLGSCSWVRVDAATAFVGFGRYVEENKKDAAWIGAIADAFDRAGGGHSLSNAALALVAQRATGSVTNEELLARLTAMTGVDAAALLSASPEFAKQLSGMNPAKIFAWWSGLNPSGSGSFSTQQMALLTRCPQLLGNLEGIPYTARSVANTKALEIAIAAAEKELAAADAAPPGSPLSPLGTAERLVRAHAQLDALRNIKEALRPLPGAESRYLISLTADHPPLAAVSIGSLETADTVTYAIPGMGTTTAGMKDWTSSAQNIYDAQGRYGSQLAVVAWIGYETPPAGPGEVFQSDYARVGSDNLRGALNGLSVVRASSMPRVNLVAHSYGSTTAAYALEQPGVHVDAFVTLGSAGLPDSVDDAGDLHADKIYSGNARTVIPFLEPGQGDAWANVGRDLSEDHHVNPMGLTGVTAFGTDSGGSVGLPVTDHGAHVGEGGAGYLDRDTESVWNVAATTMGRPEAATPYAPLSMTPLQRGLLDPELRGGW